MGNYNTVIDELSLGADDETLAQRFRPIFQRISATALQREQQRQLPFEPIQWLKTAGFGAVRVPVRYGGAGASLPQLLQLLTELAAADSNITQALRGHFAFVEDRLNAHRDQSQKKWFERFVAGELVGNAWTEVGQVKIGEVITRVKQQPNGTWIVSGKKYYSTGSIFADWLDLFAQIDHSNQNVIVALPTQHEQIQIEDDWDGFGQRTTGSGTVTIHDVAVDAENMIDFEQRFKYQTAFYQVVLLSVLSGTAQAAVKTFSEQVKLRTRVYSHGNADRVDQDAQVLQVIGKATAQAYAAEAITDRAAHALQDAYKAHFSAELQSDSLEKQANIAAELASAQGQVVVADLVLTLTTQLFNALGASATSMQKSLDRFWRNARTAASHNPIIYKERIIGDYVVNGTEPPYVWQIGGGSLQK
ncbi:acyl-CoA dehydrogenase family protein [Acinetobacter sp. MD2]|uniref:acyl-CoA dehydrogenase family protein n=1 Tax=Acinetobacter sp. MD2 TaxID=2600066 RepID=UPI002D1F5B63|nr:acyl-CoA dehydrogenase family protein [Acinetobacter sp. MD2]MEB3766781.1 acyl-CoA dehydrogenase family protein [Acinetobacter sp. MD2]